jgi:hypothetical protein
MLLFLVTDTLTLPLNLTVFQIHGNNGGHIEYSQLRAISNNVIRDVLWGHVRNYGEVSA